MASGWVTGLALALAVLLLFRSTMRPARARRRTVDMLSREGAGLPPLHATVPPGDQRRSAAKEDV